MYLIKYAFQIASELQDRKIIVLKIREQYKGGLNSDTSFNKGTMVE